MVAPPAYQIQELQEFVVPLAAGCWEGIASSNQVPYLSCCICCLGTLDSMYWSQNQRLQRFQGWTHHLVVENQHIRSRLRKFSSALSFLLSTLLSCFDSVIHSAFCCERRNANLCLEPQISSPLWSTYISNGISEIISSIVQKSLKF